MSGNEHFHRGYSLRLHKSKPFINYGIISYRTFSGACSWEAGLLDRPFASCSYMPGSEDRIRAWARDAGVAPLLGEGPSRRYLCVSIPACLAPYPGGS